MADDSKLSEKSFLRRWSERKHAVAREAVKPQSAPAPVDSAQGMPAGGAMPAGSAPAATAPGTAATARDSTGRASGLQDEPLPPIESLTFDSDFTAFLAPKVDESVKRDALKKLFSDPHFNVMDGLDVYIDDYSKFEPIPPDVLAKLEHSRYIFDPPKTRVNERGEVEDAPPDDMTAEEGETEAGPTSTDRSESMQDDATEAVAADEEAKSPSAAGTGAALSESEAGREAELTRPPIPPADTVAAMPVRPRVPDADEPQR